MKDQFYEDVERMILKYKNNDSGYEDWLEVHQSGFVFNFFGSEANNIVHHANCGYLKRPSDNEKRTILEKICSDNYQELQTEIHQLCRDKWRKCIPCEKRQQFK